MTGIRRWCVVLVATVIVVATPMAFAARPVGHSDIGAGELLAKIRAARERPWSGLLQTEGTLRIPDASQFSNVAGLLGEPTRMRAWWRDDAHWRVDQLLTSGETDLIHDGRDTWTWSFERARATLSHDPVIRLPRASDFVPPVLADRLLSGVADGDVRRLADRRIAGHDADGLRLLPGSSSSSIAHTDLWADRDTGIPVLVEVYADGQSSPAFVSAFQDFSTTRPASDTVSFAATSSTDVNFDDVLDIADAANQYAPVRPPDTVAGMTKAASSDRAVGVYGRGMTAVIAIPLRDREADAFRDQLSVTPGVEKSADRTQASVGPLGMLLTGHPGQGGWLLTGTLTPEALGRAADDVVAGAVSLGFDR